MPQAAIAADLHQALDVHGNFAAQVALYLDVVVNVVAQLADIILGQILHAGIGIDARMLDDIVGDVAANAVDVRQGDLDSLLPGKVDTSNSCHVLFAPPTCFYAMTCNRRYCLYIVPATSVRPVGRTGSHRALAWGLPSGVTVNPH